MPEAIPKKMSLLSKKDLLKTYRLMCTARKMAELYDQHKEISSNYVHSTSRGHEAIQLAAGLLLEEYDYASLYYRDESFLLGIGVEPLEMMLQLMAKGDDPFSGGRSYYSHPSIKRKGFPIIPHQSSATGMQAIPATGMAQGIVYLEQHKIKNEENKPIVICSMGDSAITEGEVAEAFQMSVLKKLPILYLIQDNNWGISAKGEEIRAMDAFEYANGFKGMARYKCNGSDFIESYRILENIIKDLRKRKGPALLHATCPLLGHHTSGVRREYYRDEKELQKLAIQDPLTKFELFLIDSEIAVERLRKIKDEAGKKVYKAWKKALRSADPELGSLELHEFAEGGIVEEHGERQPEGAKKISLAEAAAYACDDILRKHPEALLYGQDVGIRLGGVFREASNLAKKYGDSRVFNTPIVEAYIVGSTAGMSAVGCKPIVEIQFADFIWPAINQLVEELSKSCYLTNGKFPVQSLIRVPIGAFGGGGPYHSGCVESALLTIKGIKVVFPSNAADMKGLMKAAFYDPNPVVMLEHKGLYWSRVPGAEEAKSIEPDEDYVIPLGKALVVQEADDSKIKQGNTAVIITYGMGVHWARAASRDLGSIEIVDLRTLYPLDSDLVFERVRKHGKALIITEEQIQNSFAESLAGQISEQCFESLDAPVMTLGAANLPAVPLNKGLEKQMLPNAQKVKEKLLALLRY